MASSEQTHIIHLTGPLDEKHPLIELRQHSPHPVVIISDLYRLIHSPADELTLALEQWPVNNRLMR